MFIYVSNITTWSAAQPLDMWAYSDFEFESLLFIIEEVVGRYTGGHCIIIFGYKHYKNTVVKERCDPPNN